MQFVIANPIAADGIPALEAAQERFGRDAILVMDESQELAATMGATSTTDTIVLDAQRRVVYRGAIDDQYGFGYALDSPRHAYLRDALIASLDGKPVLVAATDAPGCTLDLPSPTQTSSDPTYFGDVAALMNDSCVECHRDGGVAPFSLTSLDDVVAHAPMIRDVVERGVMPPWFAAPPKDGGPSPWANDRSLSDLEKQTLTAWIANGKPAGDAASAVPLAEFPEGWTIGQPDAVYKFAKPVAVKATGTMPYKNVLVETDQEEDRWVEAVEIRPGDRSVVHHVIVSLLLPPDPVTGKREVIDSAREGFWGAYVPGMSKIEYPEGFAKKLPKGASLVFQMHYTPNGTPTEDSTRIGLRFAKQAPKYQVQVKAIANTKFGIPPGADNHRLEASGRLPANAKILGYLPHAHLRGKACRYELVRSDGSTETLLDVPHYDFNWQLLYRYAEPNSLQSDDTIRYVAWYDNSEANPANPDPERTVGWGQQTYDEMHLGYVEYFIPAQLWTRPRAPRDVSRPPVEFAKRFQLGCLSG